MRISRYLCVLTICCQSLPGAAQPTAECIRQFRNKLLGFPSDGSITLKYRYMDSLGTIHEYLTENILLFNQLHSKGISDPKKIMRGMICSDSVFRFSDFGRLWPLYEITDRRFIDTFKRKGQSKFIQRFFRNGVLNEQATKPPVLYSVLAAALELGIVMYYSDDQRTYHIHYASKCFEGN